MLCIDRHDLPALPRPIYQIQAEWISPNEIRVTAMAGQGETSHAEEFSTLDIAQLGSRLSDWLLGFSCMEHANTDWMHVTRDVSARVAQWIVEQPHDRTA